MNFREIYKSANDEIHGDRALIEQVIKKAEKRPVYRFVYPAACVAAAFAVVVAVSLKPATKPIENPNINIASNELQNPKPDSALIDVAKVEENNNAAVDKSIPQNKISAEPKEELKAEIIPESDETNGNTAQPESDMGAINDNLMVAMLLEDEVPQDRSADMKNARISSGGGSDLQIEFEGKTAEQYCQYIGKDIAAEAHLPEGMVFDTFFGATVKRDIESKEMISDSADFYARGEGKYLSVSTTKLIGKAAEILADESFAKTDINGTAAVIDGDESINYIYFKFADVYYTVYTEGLEQEEVMTLLTSICKN